MAPTGGCLGSCLAKILRTLGRGSGDPGPPEISTREAGEAGEPELPSAAGHVRRSEAVQALFQLLKQERRVLESCAPGQPPEGLANALRARLDEVQAEDLGVGRESASLITNTSGVGYQEVYSGPEMTVCIFLLRAGGRMPLHDHPEMHVFGRLLFGRLRVVSLDLEPAGGGFGPGGGAPPRGQPGTLWATLYSDTVLGPTPVTYSLSPTEGNLHEMEALEDCAFLDIVTPPYDPHAGRDCTWYKRASEPDPSGRLALAPAWPRDFSTELQDYRGPAFAV